MHPKLLYRSFTREEYAEQFIDEGILRFCSLKNYRQSEDIDCADPLEGYGELNTDGEAIVVDLANETLTPIPGTETLRVGAL